MNSIQFNDVEAQRQRRYLTSTQRKKTNQTKEGVVVNSLIKDNANSTECNLNDTYDSLLISRNIEMPEKLYEKNSSGEKSLLPISAIAVGVMGGITALTAFISKNISNNQNIDELKKLPDLTRNCALNEETHQALYHMIKCTNKKTILAGTGVLALTAMAFMGKTFLEGFRDVWVKKREADIQKNLQEKLIDIETQSFSGKIQIVRSMMSEKAAEFSKYISNDNEEILPNFGKKVFGDISFKGRKDNPKAEKDSSNVNYFLLGAATFVSIVGLGFVALKNLTKGKSGIETSIKTTRDAIDEIIKASTKETAENDKATLTKLFDWINASDSEIKTALKNLKGSPEEKEEFTNFIIKKLRTSTTKVDSAVGGDGTPKPTFYSHVDDYRAFFYNYLLDTKNPYFKQLFFGITGLTAIGYSGKLAGEAIKDVQVKKINADTEADLQQRLVSTELRNFKAKKDASVQPLMQEFYKQVDNGKPKEELKVMADNILFEIKNGAPFVYS